MNVLVACEYSGIVRDAFLDAGHFAVSCDLLPSESSKGGHFQGDVVDFMRVADWSFFDLLIAHIPCTRFANSGVRWYHERPDYRREMSDLAGLWRFLWDIPIKHKAFENPIPHKYAVDLIGKPTQYVQPWQFGHGETKAIGLWLDNLPNLKPTEIVEGREARVHKMAPGPNRAKERSRFFTGVAKAMADQWGCLK